MRLLVTCTIIAALAGCVGSQDPPLDPSANVAPPLRSVTLEAIHLALDLGEVTIVLYPEAAPQTVALMEALANEHYYDGREFNRVVPGHVIQVVDKAGGSTDDPRRVPLEVPPTHHFSAGAAGIARGADPASGGPEFFIMDFATSHLDGNYTVWGQVVEGLDVVHTAARAAAVDASPLGAAPVVSDYLTDRQAIQAPKIITARVTTVDLSAESAAALPYNVGKNVRVGDHRHTLDHPADLRVGHESRLAWYVRSSNADHPPPVGSDVKIRTPEGLRDVRSGSVPGIYAWTWTPASAGDISLTFVQGGNDIATMRVNVRG